MFHSFPMQPPQLSWIPSSGERLPSSGLHEKILVRCRYIRVSHLPFRGACGVYDPSFDWDLDSQLCQTGGSGLGEVLMVLESEVEEVQLRMRELEMAKEREIEV